MVPPNRWLIALHGFLGLPGDWSPVFGSDLRTREWQIETPNLWESLDAISTEVDRGADAFAQFAYQLNQQVECAADNRANVQDRDAASALASAAADEQRIQSRAERSPISHDKQKPFLLGYSLGGRLAMHAAIARPDLYSGLILVSAHPGLMNDDERKARIENDQKWADRIENDSWFEFLSAWNAQAVLQPPVDRVTECIGLSRKEQDFSRTSLAKGMRVWSLGLQRSLREKLRSLDLPLLQISGAHDRKFTQLQLELNGGVAGQSQNPMHKSLQLNVLPSAGHRVPWDHPKEFVRVLSDWMTEVSRRN